MSFTNGFSDRSCARHPGTVTVLDARRAGYPAAFFADATHLNSPRSTRPQPHGRPAAVAAGVASPEPPSSSPGWVRSGPTR